MTWQKHKITNFTNFHKIDESYCKLYYLNSQEMFQEEYNNCQSTQYIFFAACHSRLLSKYMGKS